MAVMIFKLIFKCRTPHGVRGLKYMDFPVLAVVPLVAPHTGCVD